eukprot:gene1833-33251_t
MDKFVKRWREEGSKDKGKAAAEGQKPAGKRMRQAKILDLKRVQKLDAPPSFVQESDITELKDILMWDKAASQDILISLERLACFHIPMDLLVATQIAVPVKRLRTACGPLGSATHLGPATHSGDRSKADTETNSPAVHQSKAAVDSDRHKPAPSAVQQYKADIETSDHISASVAVNQSKTAVASSGGAESPEVNGEGRSRYDADGRNGGGCSGGGSAAGVSGEGISGDHANGGNGGGRLEDRAGDGGPDGPGGGGCGGSAAGVGGEGLSGDSANGGGRLEDSVGGDGPGGGGRPGGGGGPGGDGPGGGEPGGSSGAGSEEGAACSDGRGATRYGTAWFKRKSEDEIWRHINRLATNLLLQWRGKVKNKVVHERKLKMWEDRGKMGTSHK